MFIINRNVCVCPFVYEVYTCIVYLCTCMYVHIHVCTCTCMYGVNVHCMYTTTHVVHVCMV